MPALTGKLLREAIAVIPDDALVFVAGMSDIWDWAYFEHVEVEAPSEERKSNHWAVMGIANPDETENEDINV